VIYPHILLYIIGRDEGTMGHKNIGADKEVAVVEIDRVFDILV